ncbi:hypothetical protein AURDEDRAFT_175181 [Auricularia subglabra TFB-10046 SS5]|nr:hypothetical protein AURDEDRAFT_175181 [Auricularia subglabra TFB-10046 SS5]
MPPPGHLVFLCLAVFLWPVLCSARIFNVTIDDTLGDEHTGERPRYTPADWKARSVGGDPCPRCTAQPDPTLAFGGTWHDKSTFVGQDPSTVSMNFTAIYVFVIIANGHARTINTTRLSFYLDGFPTPDGTFLHEPDETQGPYLYNQLVFSERLPTGSHTLVVANVPGDEDGSLVLFDYAVYTTEEPDSTDSRPSGTGTTSAPPETPTTGLTPARSAPNTKAIAGAAVGGVVVALVLLAIAYRLYSRQKAAQQASIRPFASQPPPPRNSSSDRSPGQVSPELSSSPSASSPAMREGGYPAGLRDEIGRMREELAQVRRLAEPPQYTSPTVSPSQERHPSFSGLDGRAKVIMFAGQDSGV